jgi:hypothetical protein
MLGSHKHEQDYVSANENFFVFHFQHITGQLYYDMYVVLLFQIQRVTLGLVLVPARRATPYVKAFPLTDGSLSLGGRLSFV